MTIDGTAIDEIADLARAGAPAERLDLGSYYVLHVGDRVHEIDLTGDAYRDMPRRKTGTVTVRDVPSFVAYFGKHGDEHSEIYADRQALTVTAVVNAHSVDGPDWGDHRLVLRLKHSDQFTAWQQTGGRNMPQVAFAEFIEDHRSDITDPPGADMLELVQTFQALTKVTFKSGTVLHSGQRQISYVEEIDARAGSKGNLVIPQTFTLALPIFDGATEADAVTARLRYRIDDGRLLLGFVLDQINDVVAGAFTAVVNQVDGEVVQPIMFGTPAT